MLWIGWKGFGEFDRLISTSEIINASYMVISDAPEEQQAHIMNLALADPGNDQQIMENLSGLSAIEKGNIDCAVRKWLTVLLEDLLLTLHGDEIYDLIKLTEFWQGAGCPQYSPHIVQGVNNDIPPADYYKKYNLRKAIEMHKSWLSTERVTCSVSTNLSSELFAKYFKGIA